MKRDKQKLVILLIMIGIMHNLSCEQEDETPQLDELQQALYVHDAKLTVELDTQYSLSNPNAFHLCIGPGDNPRCYNLPITSTACSNTSSNTFVNCIFEFHHSASTSAGAGDPLGSNQPEDDHPFVNHPDDWDTLYLRYNSSGSSQSIRNVTVNVEKGLAGSGVYNDYYTYVDRVIPAWETVHPGRYSFDEHVRQRRECVFKTAFCGSFNGNICRPDTEACHWVPGLATIGDVNLELMPRSVLNIIRDIGQIGMSKWAPHYPGSGGGCFGVPGFYLKHFSSNNLHYDCEEDSNVALPRNVMSSSGFIADIHSRSHFCIDGFDNDGDGVTDETTDGVCSVNETSTCNPAIQECASGWTAIFERTKQYPHICSYYKYYGNDSGLGGKESIIWIDQFIASKHAAIVLFDENHIGERGRIAGSPNPNSYSICRMDKDAVPSARQRRISGVGSYWECDPGQTYTPKAGDYFQISRMESSSHVMVWLGAPPIGVNNGGDGPQWGGAIYESSGLARLRMYPINRTQFFFGEVDYEHAATIDVEQTIIGSTLL